MESKERGYKESADAGKLDLTLFPAWAKELLDQTFNWEWARVITTQVLSYGEQKYDRDNWLKGLKLTELLQAAERHTLKHRAGEIVDPESGCLHLAHAACLHVMMLELFLQDRLDSSGAELNPKIREGLKKQHKKAQNVLSRKQKDALMRRPVDQAPSLPGPKGYEWPPKPRD